MTLSNKFNEALQYAASAHGSQLRKGTAIPYLSHLLAVASIVLEHGGTEDEAIAGLLHDAVEDAGGQERLHDIRRRFGERVAQIVEGCSDTDVVPKPPWRQRKESYIEHLREADGGTRLVSAADKLHDARSILRDLLESGDALWTRFTGGKDGSLWYYRALSDEFQRRDRGPLAVELDRVVTEIQRISGCEGSQQ